MINAKTVSCKLPDVATYERAKKGKIYPTGCTCLQVSASKGQLVYLHNDQMVDAKYCVIQPDTDRLDPYFFHLILKKEMPEFLSKEQTGLNIKPQVLERFPIRYFVDMEIQRYISAEHFLYDAEMQHEQDQIEMLRHFKAYMMQLMFC